jgi:tetratricopeptide (TPR) repeat protein
VASALLGLSLVTAFASAQHATAAIDSSLLKSQEGTAALLRGKFDQAIASFDEALKDSSLPAQRQASLYSDRGVAKWRLKQLDAAIADLTKAISLNPDFATAYNNRGNIYLELNRDEDALKDFNKALSLSQGFGPAYANRGNARDRLNQTEQAADDFHKAIELMPGNAIPYNGRGKVALALGEPYTALRYLNRSIGLNGQYSAAYANRAKAYFVVQRYDDAEQDLEKVITVMPDKAAFYVLRGQAYARDKKATLALRDFTKALELEPKNAEALIGRASQSFDRRRPEAVLDDINQAIASDPKFAEAYFWRGQVRTAMNDAEAEKDFTTAIELDPSYSEAYRLRGALREKAGQKDLAIADYKRALETDPFSKDARDAYRTAAGEPPENAVKPIGQNVAGWDVYNPAPKRYIAANERYPRLQVLLQMEGEGQPEILEWTPLKDALNGIGLLRYRAGTKKNGTFENVAILDLYRNQVIAVEPYLAGEGKASWNWTQTNVTITDTDGLVSSYELRKQRPVETQPRVANDDPFASFFGGRSRGGRRGNGIFGWLFQ